MSAYDELAAANVRGVPRLLADNALLADDASVRLFLVQDRISGSTLDVWIKRNGVLAFADARTVITRLAETLSGAHRLGIVHRDVKPGNIILEDDDLGSPMLVDFGLSFNDLSEDGATRVGEEIGNRFLRLPEHAFASRSAISDVTQLGGILYFVLTGVEPRVLRDDDGRAPHSRPVVGYDKSGLSDLGRIRLDSLFDRVFSVVSTRRFQSAEELVAEMDKIIDSDDTPTESALDRLKVERQAQVGSEDHERMRRVQAVITAVHDAAQQTARQLDLSVTQTGHELNRGELSAGTRLALTEVGSSTHTFVRFLATAPDEHSDELSADGSAIWRGSIIDDAFVLAVGEALADRYVREQDGE